MRETIAQLMATASRLLATIMASMQAHKWWWAGGGGAAVVAIVALVIVFGGFLGPSGKAICTVALEHARAYGVLPQSAVLSEPNGESTDVRNRRLCKAEADGANYNILADLATGDTPDAKCKRIRDLAKSKACVALYSVERPDGLSLYQVRQVPDDAEDAPMGVDAGNAGDGHAHGAGEAQGSAFDSDIQPATGTHGSEANQQPPGPQQ